MVIELIKKWTSGQGIELKPGDKIDIDRATYNQLVSEGICEALEGEKKAKKKTKKIKTDGDSSNSDNK